MAKKSITDQVLEQLEEMKLRSLLNTEEKTERYVRSRKSGYSPEFALIFALQEDQKPVHEQVRELNEA